MGSPGSVTMIFLGWLTLTYLNCKDGIWSGILWFVFSIIMAAFLGLLLWCSRPDNSSSRPVETEDERMIREFLLFKRHEQ